MPTAGLGASLSGKKDVLLSRQVKHTVDSKVIPVAEIDHQVKQRVGTGGYRCL
jgi:hypothetical protein